ncbi:MAG: NapC/NirT family cytochrome c [Anaerolineales bacterium]
MLTKRHVFTFILGGVALGLVFLSGGTIYAAHLENQDSFCASCHTEPESTYVERKAAAAASDLATRHNQEGVRCIDCHSGAGITGRLSAMTTGAGDFVSYRSGNYNDPAVITTPYADDNCLKCHAEVTKTRTFERHFHALLPRWQQLAPANAASCVDCHQAHVLDGIPELGFLQETPTTGVCNDCHRFIGENE